jgi:hypothetical protein
MSQIVFEDRTTESPEETAQRQVEVVSRAIIGTTILASQGSPTVGMAALIMALAQGTARTGASIDAVIEALKSDYQEAVEDPAPWSERVSDA